MRNVLLLVHDDDGQEARLQAALDVVRATEGHLSCLDVAVLPMLVTGYYGAPEQGILLAEEVARESANRARLEERLRHEDVAWDWVDSCGTIVSCVTAAAGLADLIVVNRKLESFLMPDMLAVAGGIIMESRKPILAVPQASRGIMLAGHALVAWDGSPAAIAAMRAAVPLLKLAEKITLLEIDDGSVAVPAEEAATYLSREDIHVSIRRERLGEHSAPERLCAESRSHQFAYIVMGGFGHSRLREAIFGGVTRRMLSESAVPLLLAH